MQHASTFIFRTPEDPEGHRHEHAQFMIGIEGTSNLVLDGKHISVDNRQGCVIPSSAYHVFAGAGANKNLTINFDTRYASDLVKRISERPRTFSLDRSLRTFLQFSAMELPEYSGCPEIGRDNFSSQVIAVLTSMLGKRIFSHLTEKRRIDLKKIDAYLDKVLHRKVSIEKLARESGISPSYFYTLFKQEIGITPHRYITEKRLAKARLMLEMTSLSIADISYETGFSSQSALNNSFKKEYGCTPGSIRKSFSLHH